MVVTQAEEAHKKEERPKSPSLLAKLLAPFKSGEKKPKEKPVKKTEKKEEVCLYVSLFLATVPDNRLVQAAPEAPKDAAPAAEEPAAAPAEPAPAAEEAPAAEPVKETCVHFNTLRNDCSIDTRF